PAIYPLSLHDALPISRICEASAADVDDGRFVQLMAMLRLSAGGHGIEHSRSIGHEAARRFAARPISVRIARVYDSKSVDTNRNRSEEHTSELQSLAYL